MSETIIFDDEEKARHYQARIWALLNDVVVGDLVLLDPVWGLEVVTGVHRHEFLWPGSTVKGEFVRLGLRYAAHDDANEIKENTRYAARFPHEPVCRIPVERGI